MKEKIENEKSKEVKPVKKGFFKKVWYSVFKLEKYGEMSAEGVRKAISYLLKLSLVISIIVSLGTIYKANKLVQKGKEFIENQVGNFSYKDGILEVEKEEPIIAPSSTFGKVIIDTKIESEEEINQYLNSMEENKGILILKDKILVRGFSSKGIVKYNYDSILQEIDMKEINEQQLIDYIDGGDISSIYIAAYIIGIIYALVVVFLPILFNAVILSLFGYIVTWVAKIKMRFAALFNLAAYALTLSIILNAIYIIVNIFTRFTITYFQVMYIALAAIYLIAAILIIKSEFIKQQVEVAGVVGKIKENEEKQEQENKDDKEDNKKDDKNEDENKSTNEKKEKKDDGTEPEGSQV